MADAPVDFIDKARNKPPSELLSAWLPKLGLHGGVALDLGCGVGAEAEYLAKSGFMVEAIDKSPVAAEATRQRCAGLTVDVVESDFLAYPLAPEKYTLAVAINSLPFVPKASCPALMRSIQASIKIGGAVVFAVYGPEHDWARMRPDMSFWNKQEFGELWDGWEPLHFEEYMGSFPLSTGEEILQHRIHLVATKNA